jgi:hypothetical protein
LALSGTERHLRPKLDQARDHETKPIFGLEEAAERLLQAVAVGAPESVKLARDLVVAVLQPMGSACRGSGRALTKQNPLALVRAVELAEAALHSTDEGASGRLGRRTNPSAGNC